jgi:LPS sulfotransferase NodH
MRWIYLHRNDTAAQAISLWLATNSGIWNCGKNSVGEQRQYASADLRWSDDDAIGFWRWLRRYDDMLQTFLDSRKHLRLTYEEVVSDPRGCVHRILDYIGAPGHAGQNLEIQLAKLEHPRKAEWTNRLKLLLRSSGCPV